MYRNEKRPPNRNGNRLEWRTFKTVERNCVRADINSAEGRHGPLFSIRFSRTEKGRDSAFFRPDDLTDIVVVTTEVKHALLEARNGR